MGLPRIDAAVAEATALLRAGAATVFFAFCFLLVTTQFSYNLTLREHFAKSYGCQFPVGRGESTKENQMRHKNFRLFVTPFQCSRRRCDCGCSRNFRPRP